MDHKKEVLEKAKEIIDKLKLEDIQRIDITVNDNYPEETDITIDLEINKKQ